MLAALNCPWYFILEAWTHTAIEKFSLSLNLQVLGTTNINMYASVLIVYVSGNTMARIIIYCICFIISITNETVYLSRENI